MNYFSNDTIAAIATSIAGDGGVGIIRLSGPQSLAAAQAICRGLEAPQPRYLHRIEVFRPGSSSLKEVLDDGLAAYFSQGQSFTGEEVVELQLHGGRFLLQNILNLLILTRKCRMALPGEFSFRAVRNGKLSLSGAEALGQLIGARSLFEVQAARRRLGHARVKEFEDLATKIRELLAQTELSIDFIDQNVEVISLEKMQAELLALLEQIDGLILQMKTAQRIAEGLRVTLIGEPNAGKSTLFNALLSEDRAIVSPEAGTTRDIITEEIALGPYRVRLADTAGLRGAEGQIEREGINRAKELAQESDLVVWVVDVSQPISKSKPSQTVGLVALNKWDLIKDTDRGRILAEVSRILPKVASIPVSAAQNKGLELLLEKMQASLDARYGEAIRSFLPTEFQLQMLLECRAALEQIQGLLKTTGLSQPELISASLNSAAKALSDLVGETTPDTVLTKIFSEFCIGK